MLSFSPYQTPPARLEDFLPWGLLVAKGIVLNKDGSFQATARFRGPDVRSATPEELVSFTARANNVFKRLGSGWAVYVEADRRPVAQYPNGDFADDLTRLIDAERAAAFETGARQFETIQHLTLQWTPPRDSLSKASSFFFEADGGCGKHSRLKRQKGADAAPDTTDLGHARRLLEDFQRAVKAAFALFEDICSEFEPLDDDDALTYLKGTISPRRTSVRAPAAGACLDGFLCDAPLLGGTQPKLGEKHLRVLTIKGFPPATHPGVLDDLNALGMSFRWSTRFLCLSKTEAERELTRWRRLWFSKHKSLAALLKETLTKENATFSNPDALAKTSEVEAALGDLGSETVGFGYLTTTLVVTGDTPEAADEKLRLAERAISARGFTVFAESLNAVEAWLSSLPGHAWANVRQPLVSTLNVAHVAPLASPWAGDEWNAHLNAPPLALAMTDGSTPFRLNLHVGDVGHMLVVGPTGAGKSVLLAFLALQWRRYNNAQVFFFDKGGSARAAVSAMGGIALDLGAESAPAVQPLGRIDHPAVRSRALDWLEGLLCQEGVDLDPERRDRLWSALTSLAAAPEDQRHLTGLRLLVQDALLQSALLPYTLDGAYGALFDGAEDRLSLSDAVLFEMEELMARPKAAGPMLAFLFDKLEERFDGRPTLLVLDEAWLFLDSPLFAARIREWLKTLRKKNVAVVFATQSLADIADSAIAPALIESCPTRIFLPNERALEPQQRVVYERFGLNETEIGLISTAQRKRDYYYASPKGRRLFDLALGPIALCVAAASDPAAQAQIRRLEDEDGKEAFWRRWLAARGLNWALEAIDDAPAPSLSANHVSAE